MKCSKAIILQADYFKLRFSLSNRDVEKLLSIRGVKVAHATIQRWVFKFTPLVEQDHRMIKKNQLLNPKSFTYKSFISLAS